MTKVKQAEVVPAVQANDPVLQKQPMPKAKPENDLNTVEGQKAQAKEVYQGQSARELLEQAAQYVKAGAGAPDDFVGSPERYKDLRAQIDAYLLLNAK